MASSGRTFDEYKKNYAAFFNISDFTEAFASPSTVLTTTQQP